MMSHLNAQVPTHVHTYIHFSTQALEHIPAQFVLKKKKKTWIEEKRQVDK